MIVKASRTVSTLTIFGYFPGFHIRVPTAIIFPAFKIDRNFYLVTLVNIKLVNFITPSHKANLFGIISVRFQNIFLFAPFTIGRLPRF